MNSGELMVVPRAKFSLCRRIRGCGESQEWTCKVVPCRLLELSRRDHTFEVPEQLHDWQSVSGEFFSGVEGDYKANVNESP